MLMVSRTLLRSSNMIENSVDLAKRVREKGVKIIHAAQYVSSKDNKESHGTQSEIKEAGFF